MSALMCCDQMDYDATVTQLIAKLVRTAGVGVTVAVGRQCTLCGDAVFTRRIVTEGWLSVMPA
jgi:hypothetical protein